MTNVLAIDLGATSGRAILGKYKDERIEIEEVTRFKGYGISDSSGMYWDISKIMKEIERAMLAVEELGGFESIAVDTWGVDFGLIDVNGELIRKPIHYRDSRTNGVLKDVSEIMNLEELYKGTGIQIMEINTLFQLLHLKWNEEETYNKASKILLMPDLINYFLTGKIYAERSIASTTQLFNPISMDWNKEIISKFELKDTLFPEVIDSGKIIGNLSEKMENKLNIENIKVVSIASHDTASAVFSIPSREQNFSFLSCGTWSLLGQELNSPIINNSTFAVNFANEIGAGGKITFLSNITGMWILEECIRHYNRNGKKYSYKDIKKIILESKEFDSFIDVGDDLFSVPGNMPKKINSYLEDSGQKKAETPGELFRLIYESLALKYKQTDDLISKTSKINNEILYIVGGGSKSEVLCQMTSDALNKTVSAGPSEATAVGNVAMQLIALKKIPNIAEAKEIINRSKEIKIYRPLEVQKWEEKFTKYKNFLIKNRGEI